MKEKKKESKWGEVEMGEGGEGGHMRIKWEWSV